MTEHRGFDPPDPDDLVTIHDNDPGLEADSTIFSEDASDVYWMTEGGTGLSGINRYSIRLTSNPTDTVYVRISSSDHGAVSPNSDCSNNAFDLTFQPESSLATADHWDEWDCQEFCVSGVI